MATRQPLYINTSTGKLSVSGSADYVGTGLGVVVVGQASDPAVSASGQALLVYNTTTGTLRASLNGGAFSGIGGGVTTLGTFGSSPNANGATITGSTLVLQPADATHPGGISLSNQTLGAGTKTVDALNATAGVRADIGFTPVQIGGQAGGVHRLEAYGTAPFPFRLLNSADGFAGLHLGAIKVVAPINTASVYNDEQKGYIGQNNGQLVMYSVGVNGPTSAGTFVWRSQNAFTNGSSDVLSSDTSRTVTAGYKLVVQGLGSDGTTPQFCVLADPAWNNARASISPLLTNNTIIPNMQTGQLWSLLDIYFDRASPNGVPLGGTMLSLGTTTTSTSLQVGQIAFYNINGRTVNSDDMRIAYIEGVTSGAKDKGALNFVTANGANALATAVSILPTGATQFVGNITKINNVVTNWPSTQGAASTVLTNDGAGNFSWAAGGGGGSGVTTVGAFGSTPTANAATITGTSIFLQPADATHPGAISLGAQTLGAGTKAVDGLTVGKTGTAGVINILRNDGAGLGALSVYVNTAVSDAVKLSNANGPIEIKTTANAADNTLDIYLRSSTVMTAQMTSTTFNFKPGTLVLGSVGSAGFISLARASDGVSLGSLKTYVNGASSDAVRLSSGNGPVEINTQSNATDNSIDFSTFNTFRGKVANNGDLSWGASGQFIINSTGNITKINNVATSWPASQGAASTFLQNDGSGKLSWVAGGSGVTTMGAFGSSPNANGATITGSTLVLQPADATHPGGWSTGTQTLPGAKTFTGAATFAGPSTTVVTVYGQNATGQKILTIDANGGVTGAVSTLVLNSGGYGGSFGTSEQRILFQASDSLVNAYMGAGYGVLGSASGFLTLGTRALSGALTEAMRIESTGQVNASSVINPTIATVGYSFVATSSGTGNAQYAMDVALGGGYTGGGASGGTNGARFYNYSAGTGAVVMGNAVPTANFGARAAKVVGTTGSNVGFLAYAERGLTRTQGLVGLAVSDDGVSTVEVIGVYGSASNGGVSGTTRRVGGMFTLYGMTDSVGTLTDSALIVDNGPVSAPIALFRANGTTKLTVGSTGVVTSVGLINADGGIDRSTASTLTIGTTNATLVSMPTAVLVEPRVGSFQTALAVFLDQSTFTGNGQTAAVLGSNNTAGTGVTPLASPLSNSLGNSGVWGGAGLATTGVNIGGMFAATRSSTRVYGAIAYAENDLSTGDIIGLYGTANNLGGTHAQVGVYAALYGRTDSIGTITNTALLVDNGPVSAPIAIFRANNVVKVTINSTGVVTSVGLINADGGIDTSGSTLNVAGTTATVLNLGRTSQVANVLGNLTVAGTTTLSGDLVSKASSLEIERRQTATVATTNATVTNLHTFATATDSIYLVEVRVSARRTGGSAGSANDSAVYVRRARAKNNGGTLSIIDLETTYTSEDQPAWDATISFSGTNILVPVTGATNNNITWTGVLVINQVA